MFRAISRGEFNISGFHNRLLRELLPQFNSGQISRLLKRLRNHGIIKKGNRSYKYYLTTTGRQVVALGLKLKNLAIVPELATVPASSKQFLPKQQTISPPRHSNASATTESSRKATAPTSIT